MLYSALPAPCTAVSGIESTCRPCSSNDNAPSVTRLLVATCVHSGHKSPQMASNWRAGAHRIQSDRGAACRCEGRPGAGSILHPHLLSRGTESPRYLGYEAQGARGSPRRVQTDRNRGPGSVGLRTSSSPGPRGRPADDHPQPASRAHQPSTGRVHNPHRPGSASRRSTARRAKR